MHVLLAEDNPVLGRGLCNGLQQLGYTVDWVTDGIAAQQAVSRSEDIDVLVLDLGLPRQDGLSVLKQLRSSGSELPVLILTARDAVDDRIKGLDFGADDYMLKPFDLHELAARLRALSRRHRGRASPLLRYKDIELDPAAHTVKHKGKPVTLSQHEFAILEKLLSHTGQVLTRQQIEASLYGWDEAAGSNVLEVHVHHLRKKLGKTLIRTVRGIGYSIPKDNSHVV
ncbi:MAG: response regulator transcription factor [Chromatiales bacterium]|jgi:DNA-binding response OmpR family regulator